MVIDDEYAANVEELLGICSELVPAESSRLPHLEEIYFDAPHAVWTDEVRETWEKLNNTERRRVVVEARKLHAASSASLADGETGQDETAADDFKAAGSLEEILGGLAGLDFVLLSLSEWREKGTTLLKGAKAQNTLVLFDRDFSREEPEAENEGLKQIHEAQSTNIGYVGLISHTVPLNDEFEAWVNLSEEHGLERDRFVVISKGRLQDPPNYYGFLGMLRLTALSGRYARVKSKAWSIFKDSLSEAKKAMESLSVLDFDRMVFASSRKEGIWEPETLLRIFHILMQREARSRLLQDQDMPDSVAAARRLSAAPEAIATALDGDNDSDESLRIQRFEIYDSDDELNRFHTPIDIGDVFWFSTNEKYYILLAQPCDLMVRKDGMRNYEDKKFGRMAAVVELVFGCTEKRENWEELPFYEEETGSSAFANLARVYQVPLVVLDLCAVCEEGSAEIDVNAECPALLIEPWEKRYQKLRSFYDKALDRYEELKNKDLDEETPSLALPGSTTSLKFGPIVTGKILKYGVKRMLRLRQPWSGALLTKFTQYQARTAFDHYFGHSTEVPASSDADQGPV
ncbi:MAG: hypothetical protein OXG98_11245 [Gemmatimonadetes bacterium]|nr:hypothetical protein [Gemmatimonadota bacterium]